MGDYLDGKAAQGGANNVNVSQAVDVDALAAAVAKAIGKVPMRGVAGAGGEFADTFDSEKSMEALAKAMTVQRGTNESNFENLGGIKETKKDKKTVDSTRDLLAGLDD